jgi:hypothetical protein
VLLLAVRDAGERPFDDEGGEVLAVDLGEDDVEVGEAAVGDPGLLAVQDEAAVGLPRGAGPGAEGIGPGARLAEAVGAIVSPSGGRGELALLGLGPEERQQQHGELACAPARRRRPSATCSLTIIE